MKLQKTDDYAGQAIEDALNALQSDVRQGLGSAEAGRRLDAFGPNEIQAREEPL